MRRIIQTAIALSLVIGFASCEEKVMVEGTLFYTPSCSSHNGHLIVPGPDSIKIIKNRIDKEFQSSNLPVKVTYVKSGDQSVGQQTGCQTGTAIRIKEIEKL